MFNLLQSCLNGNEPIQISGFGTFYIKHLKSGMYRNPRSGQQVELQNRYNVGFKPSLKLRAELNEALDDLDILEEARVLYYAERL